MISSLEQEFAVLVAGSPGPVKASMAAFVGQLMRRLANDGIETRLSIGPVHLHLDLILGQSSSRSAKEGEISQQEPSLVALHGVATVLNRACAGENPERSAEEGTIGLLLVLSKLLGSNRFDCHSFNLHMKLY